MSELARPMIGAARSAAGRVRSGTHAASGPLLVGLVAMATWDGWRWFIARIAATPEEALSLALTLGLLISVGIGAAHAPTRRPTRLPLLPLAGLLALYALSFAFAPPIVRAALAVTATLYAAWRTLTGSQPPVAFFPLVALSLPVVPSRQFVLGYPMRLVSASLTVALLKVQGLAVEREGTHLLWAGQRIEFDAPCSGVNMLWAGLLLTLLVCTCWRSGWVVTAAAVVLSLAATLAANVLRAASLFYVEAGLVTGAAPWWHTGIGLTAFSLAAALMLKSLILLRDMEARWTRP
ncbi:MAG: archaeosortase/exosortase family protein [Hyphomicrobium sp.]